MFMEKKLNLVNVVVNEFLKDFSIMFNPANFKVSHHYW